MMHIIYSPYFHKIYKFPPIFVQFTFFASPYFAHDAFMLMLHTYWTPLLNSDAGISVSGTCIGFFNFDSNNDKNHYNNSYK